MTNWYELCQKYQFGFFLVILMIYNKQIRQSVFTDPANIIGISVKVCGTFESDLC